MTTSNDKPKPDVRFFTDIPDPERAVFSDGVRYAKFTCRAVVLSHDPANPGAWGCDSYSIETRGVRHLDGLEITAQADTRERHPFLTRVDRPEHDFEGTGYRSMDASALDYHIGSRCTEIRKLLGIDPDSLI